MKTRLLCALMATPFALLAQQSDFEVPIKLKGRVEKPISAKLYPGVAVELDGLYKNEENMVFAHLIANGELFKENPDFLDKIQFFPNDSREFWQHQMLVNESYEYRTKKGLQLGLRKELENEALDYLSIMEEKGLLFEDDYLENYLYSLVHKIYPGSLADGRPGFVNVKIIKDSYPNAYIFSNGTVCVTTGLLSCINSEDELLAALSHEVAHFVLDHSVININKALQRKARAEFWALFATGVAAATEVYATVKDKNHTPGFFTYNVAVIASDLAYSVIDRLGLKFDREQELEADKAARALMSFIKKDPIALSVVLDKMRKQNTAPGNYMALTGKGTHPDIDERIGDKGLLREFNDPLYNPKISLVNSFSALAAFEQKQFDWSEKIANRNIASGVAVESDYWVLAMANMSRFDTQPKNEEALAYLEKAEKLNVEPNVDIFKQKALVLLRLGKKEEAKAALLLFKSKLNEIINAVSGKEMTNLSIQYSDVFKDEYNWSVKMLGKMDKL